MLNLLNYFAGVILFSIFAAKIYHKYYIDYVNSATKTITLYPN